MHIPRIYIDTSVIGGCFDEMFAEMIEEMKNMIILDIMKPSK
ncbi:MAG: hypothetical protein QG635_2236 [Bacteroidota bacterium]|nr:hypothetical protein [Bacteroidota bacterium]